MNSSAGRWQATPDRAGSRQGQPPVQEAASTRLSLSGVPEKPIPRMIRSEYAP